MIRALAGIYTFVDKIKQNFWLSYLENHEKEGRLEAIYPDEHAEWLDARSECRRKHLKYTPELKSFKTYMYQKKIS